MVSLETLIPDNKSRRQTNTAGSACGVTVCVCDMLINSVHRLQSGVKESASLLKWQSEHYDIAKNMIYAIKFKVAI